MIKTEHLPDERTYTKVAVAVLTKRERHLIMEGDLAYCKPHQTLRRLEALPLCPVYLLACKCGNSWCKNTPKLKDLGPCQDLEL